MTVFHIVMSDAIGKKYRKFITPGAQITIKDAMLTYRMNECIATVNDVDDIDVCINSE